MDNADLDVMEALCEVVMVGITLMSRRTHLAHSSPPSYLAMWGIKMLKQ